MNKEVRYEIWFSKWYPTFQQGQSIEEEIFHEAYKEGDQVPSTTEISQDIKSTQQILAG